VERAVVQILILLLGLLGLGIVAVLLKMFAGKSLKTLFADQDKIYKTNLWLGLLLFILVFLVFVIVNN
jgi:hypothetical protein